MAENPPVNPYQYAINDALKSGFLKEGEIHLLDARHKPPCSINPCSCDPCITITRSRDDQALLLDYDTNNPKEPWPT